MEMNGHEHKAAEPAIDQAELFGFGFQYAIENVGNEIGKDGTVVRADAVIFALAHKLGEQIGEVMDRNSRRLIEKKVGEIIRKSTIIRRAEKGLQL